MTGNPRFEPLPDDEFECAMKELAQYEEAVIESDRLADEDTIAKAEVLHRVFRDGRWVKERNAERAAAAKTPQGGRPVDPTSRSQFSQWLNSRFRRLQSSHAYRLLDAHRIVTEFLPPGGINPTTERQVRPLTRLTRVRYGSGARIPETWEMACRIAADKGYAQPTSTDVREAITQWGRLHHTPPTRARKEPRPPRRTEAQELRSKVINDWREFIQVADRDEIKQVLDRLQADIDWFKGAGDTK